MAQNPEFELTRRELDVVGRKIVQTVSICWLPTIRLVTGDAVVVVDPARKTSQSGYTIVRSSEFVATMCVRITAFFLIAWMYRYPFAHDIMVSSQDAVLLSETQTQLREFLPMMIAHQLLGSTTFLVDRGGLGYRLPEPCSPVWCTDGDVGDYLAVFDAVCKDVWNALSWQQHFELKSTFSFSNRRTWQCQMGRSPIFLAWPMTPLHVLGNLSPNELAWSQRQRKSMSQQLKAACLDDRQVLPSGSMSNSVVGSSSSAVRCSTGDQTTGLTLNTTLNPAKTTPGYRMDSPFLMMNGGVA
eukprot:4557089-Amphidinium_carterae.1